MAHFLHLQVTITPLVKIEDDHWLWHLGLDMNATAILNDLWQGRVEDRLREILCLFKRPQKPAKPEMAGHPVYMGLAMNAAGIVQ